MLTVNQRTDWPSKFEPVPLIVLLTFTCTRLSPSTSLSATLNDTGCPTFQFVVENVSEAGLTVTRLTSSLATATVVAAVGSDDSEM